MGRSNEGAARLAGVSGLYSDGPAIVLHHQIVLVVDRDGLAFLSILLGLARVGELGALGTDVRQEVVAGDRSATDQSEVVCGRELPLGVQAMGAEFDDRTTIAFAGWMARELGGFVPPGGFAD